MLHARGKHCLCIIFHSQRHQLEKCRRLHLGQMLSRKAGILHAADLHKLKQLQHIVAFIIAAQLM